MDILEIMESRHSVRRYLDKPIELEKREILNSLCFECNNDSGLSIRIIYDEPKCFKSFMARYGNFKGCSNYIAMIGRNIENIEEICGYYGEKLVLKAQELGLNTCWVGLTHGKCQVTLKADEKIVIVISLGYGETQGNKHKDKPLSKVSNLCDESPDWFKKGMEAVMLAPTAINQQKFYFKQVDDEIFLSDKGGPYSKVDIGIVKYHFETITGKKVNRD